MPSSHRLKVHWAPQNYFPTPAPQATPHPHPLQMSIESLLSDPYGFRWEVPMTLSSGSVNLLEQLTELRKTACLPDDQFIMKERNSGP